MQINLVWDPSVDNAPDGFAVAMQAAAAYLDGLISDPITVNIQVGFGEVADHPLADGEAGEDWLDSTAYGTVMTYGQVQAQLAAHATSAVDSSVLAHLGVSIGSVNPLVFDPVYVPAALEKAWGLVPADAGTIDGAVGFSATYPNFNYDPNNRSVAGQIDFTGMAIHELTHALGRASLASTTSFATILDLFRYTAPGQQANSPSVASYFSVNGGVTNLKQFDTVSDPSDWARPSVNDAFDAYANTGAALAVSPVDIEVLDALGYTIAGTGGLRIAGTVATQTVMDQMTATPFSGVGISNAAPSETVTVTLSAAANGTLSNPFSGTYDPASGVYSVTGSAATVTAALQGLVLTPTLGQVPQGQSVTTLFTIHATDAIGDQATDSTTTVTTLSSGQWNAIPLATAMQSSGGSVSSAGTVYIGTTPIGWIASAAAVDTVTSDMFRSYSGTMAAEMLAQASTANVLFQNQTLTALGAPFSAQGVTIQGSTLLDPADTAAADDIHYLFAPAAPAGTSFLLWAPGGNQNGNTGPFTFSFTAKLHGAAVSTAGWRFSVQTPSGAAPVATYTTNATTGQVTVSNYTGVTAFPEAVIVVTTDAPIDDLDVVAITVPYDFWGLAIAGTTPMPQPVISGTTAGQTLTDDGVISPLSHISVTDAPVDQQETATVTLSNPANGTLQDGWGGNYDAATGIYTFTGTAANVTLVLQRLTFTPSRYRATPGHTATTTLTVSITDTAGASATDSTTSVISLATASSCGITGTGGYQSTPDIVPIALFPAISLTDQLPGQTETVTVALSDPQDGSLTNLAGGRYGDTTGVYTVSGTPAAVTAALQGLVFVPTVHPPQAGNATTTSFLVNMIDTAGMTAGVTAAMVTATAAGGPASSAAVAAAYGAMLQSAPTRTAAATIAAQIDSGMTTTSGWEASLLTSPAALESVLPSLVVIDAFYGVTPSSAVLAAVASTVQGWGTLGMTAADQWSVLGLQFAHNDSFGAAYGALDNSAFAGQIYQAVFGTAPPAAIQAVLADNVTALAAAYHGYDPVHSDMLGGKGALYAALLYYAETTQQGRYFSAANAFLTNEANAAFAAGTAPDYAQGVELRQRFPGGMAAAPAAMTVSNSTIDPGVGDHAMAFVSSDVQDIVVLHLGGIDDIAGFDVTAGDALAVGSLLAEAQVCVQDFGQLGSYVSVSAQGADAVVSFQAPGGTASPVAVLQGLGSAIGSFDDLLRMNALRF